MNRRPTAAADDGPLAGRLTSSPRILEALVIEKVLTHLRQGPGAKRRFLIRLRCTPASAGPKHHRPSSGPSRRGQTTDCVQCALPLPQRIALWVHSSLKSSQMETKPKALCSSCCTSLAHRPGSACRMWLTGRGGMYVAAAVSSALSQPVIADSKCSCGPTYCQDTPGYRVALSQKKRSLEAQPFSPRAIAIFDKVSRCEAAIRTAPDGFSVLIRERNESITTTAWGQERERNGADELKRRVIKDCRVILVRHAFACCGEPSATQRADYDRALDLNTSMAISCSE